MPWAVFEPENPVLEWFKTVRRVLEHSSVVIVVLIAMYTLVMEVLAVGLQYFVIHLLLEIWGSYGGDDDICGLGCDAP
jgi:hypothetical protein